MNDRGLMGEPVLWKRRLELGALYCLHVDQADDGRNQNVRGAKKLFRSIETQDDRLEKQWAGDTELAKRRLI